MAANAIMVGVAARVAWKHWSRSNCDHQPNAIRCQTIQSLKRVRATTLFCRGANRRIRRCPSWHCR